MVRECYHALQNVFHDPVTAAAVMWKKRQKETEWSSSDGRQSGSAGAFEFLFFCTCLDIGSVLISWSGSLQSFRCRMSCSTDIMRNWSKNTESPERSCMI